TPEDGRPIFLEEVGTRGEPEPHAVAAESLPARLFFHRKIAIRQALSEDRPKHPGPINAFRSCIRASDNQTAEAIAHPTPRAAAQAYKVSRVPAQQSGKQN